MKEIELQINDLLELKNELDELLEKKSYEEFEQKQNELAKSIHHFFEKNSKKSMNEFILKLKELEENIDKLQSTATKELQDLKRRSLLQKRNKNKLNAYK